MQDGQILATTDFGGPLAAALRATPRAQKGRGKG